MKTRKQKTQPATPVSIKVEGANVIIDGVSYRIPRQLLDSPTEQIIAFYKGWYRKTV